MGPFSLRFSVTRTVLTGPRAPQEVHREDATTRRERPNAIGIDTNSGPGQYGAVCKDLRGSVYPHPRTGHKGASQGRLWGAGATPRGLGRDFYWCGRPVSSASHQLFKEHKISTQKTQSGANVEAAGGRARALPIRTYRYEGKGLKLASNG